MTPQEKIMKKVAATYVDVYGIQKDQNILLDSGNIIFIVAPNRFGPGYIRVMYPATNEVWSSDFNKNGKVHNCYGEKINPITGTRTTIN